MKKFILLALFLVLPMNFACNNDESLGTSYVRFKNSTSENYTDGLRVNTAQIETILAGAQTAYYEVTEGQYNLEHKLGGIWTMAKPGWWYCRCEEGRHYTLTISGNSGNWEFLFESDD